MAYIYQPLPQQREWDRRKYFTRMLLLEGAADEEPLRGYLEIIDLEQAPRYEALSYTWGADNAQNCIRIQGCPMPIKPNLEMALRHLRLRDQARRLWVDALCINQGDLDERALQVQYMVKVYKYAARVIVWIGLKVPGVEEAFLAAKELAEAQECINREANTLGGTGPASFDLDVVRALLESAVEGLPDTWFDNLRMVFERPYFKRCWCVQEVVASQWAIVKCEELEMSFLDLISTITLMGLARHDLSMAEKIQNNATLWYRIYQRKTSQEKQEVEGSIGDFLTLLDETRTQEATDIRDRVWSLLGICDEGIRPSLATTQVLETPRRFGPVNLARKVFNRMQDHIALYNTPPSRDFRPEALVPNYRKDPVSVFCDLTRFLLRKSPRILDALNHVQHHQDPELGEYPSWVPKWFEPRRSMVFPRGIYLSGFCDGHFRYFAKLHDSPLTGQSQQPRVLSLDGYRCDVVQAMSDEVDFQHQLEGLDLALAVISKVWLQLFGRPLSSHDAAQYFDGTSLTRAFLLAMGAGTLASISGMAANQQIGLHVVGDPIAATLKEDPKTLPYKHIDALMKAVEHVHQTQGQSLAPDDERYMPASIYLAGIRVFATARRVFVTKGGRLGLGPKMMQPGDEVVVLFGGRLPFVVRPKGDHHVFVGSCYVADDQIMWGAVTEMVINNRGGPPRFTFELR